MDQSIKTLAVTIVIGLAMLAPTPGRCCEPYLGDRFELQPETAATVPSAVLGLRHVGFEISRGTGPGPGDCSDLAVVTFSPKLQVDTGTDFGIRISFLGGTAPPTSMFPNYVLARNERGPNLYWFEDLESFDFTVSVSAVHRSGVEGKPYMVHLTGERLYLPRVDRAWFRIRRFWNLWGTLVLPPLAVLTIVGAAVYWRRRKKASSP